MDEVIIKPYWLKKAKQKSEEMGVLRNSISGGQGNIMGFIGEYAVLSLIKGGRIHNTYDYDIKTAISTIDVKTKRTRVKPLPHYMCSVAAYNTKQNCTYYVFVRMLSDYTKCWVLGWLGKEKYFENATFLRKGEEDGDNGYIVKADCYNLPINKLNEIEFFS